MCSLCLPFQLAHAMADPSVVYISKRRYTFIHSLTVLNIIVFILVSFSCTRSSMINLLLLHSLCGINISINILLMEPDRSLRKIPIDVNQCSPV